MFGLNEICWGRFIQFIVFVLLGWYVVVILLAWIRAKNQQAYLYYEDHRTDNSQLENLQPISVSSKEFPSERLPLFSIEEIPLEISFYEDNGLEEGYGIEHFIEENNPNFSEILKEIQYQQ
jgi:hypothetical protein